MGERRWRKRFGFRHVAFDDTISDEGPLCTPLGNDAPARIEWWFLRKGSGSDSGFLRDQCGERDRPRCGGCSCPRCSARSTRRGRRRPRRSRRSRTRPPRRAVVGRDLVVPPGRRSARPRRIAASRRRSRTPRCSGTNHRDAGAAADPWVAPADASGVPSDDFRTGNSTRSDRFRSSNVLCSGPDGGRSSGQADWALAVS